MADSFMRTFDADTLGVEPRFARMAQQEMVPEGFQRSGRVPASMMSRSKETKQAEALRHTITRPEAIRNAADAHIARRTREGALVDAQPGYVLGSETLSGNGVPQPGKRLECPVPVSKALMTPAESQAALRYEVGAGKLAKLRRQQVTEEARRINLARRNASSMGLLGIVAGTADPEGQRRVAVGDEDVAPFRDRQRDWDARQHSTAQRVKARWASDVVCVPVPGMEEADRLRQRLQPIAQRKAESYLRPPDSFSARYMTTGASRVRPTQRRADARPARRDYDIAAPTRQTHAPRDPFQSRDRSVDVVRTRASSTGGVRRIGRRGVSKIPL
ncbi:hypothetical protein KIPB_004931 [Kipferlia bialata]|uniref:Uncharacterized protein n=1 Tax=Kipferlia bialata TaxID=797122 RepID=A0A9K3CVV3_9EUKA|nr:hypothetical protein KIPB_004931 [Kipferlia bialata]|eukprot:g4931.t1